MSDYQFNPDVEQWKAVKGFPGYDIGDHGNVRSYWKHGAGYSKEPRIRNTPQRILKPRFQQNGGYAKVTLVLNGKHHLKNIHTLVLEAFVGPQPFRMECCHNDGNPVNNWANNLRWDTHRNNKLDSLKHGTMPLGDKHHNSKLTADCIPMIRFLHSQGVSLKKISIIYHVHLATILQVASRKTWKDI